MAAETKAAALQRRDAARTALSAAQDALAAAVARSSGAARTMGQIEQQLGSRSSVAYQEATQAWRAAQREELKLAQAAQAALDNWRNANAAALRCGR
jgi:hypothetical protein